MVQFSANQCGTYTIVMGWFHFLGNNQLKLSLASKIYKIGLSKIDMQLHLRLVCYLINLFWNYKACAKSYCRQPGKTAPRVVKFPGFILFCQKMLWLRRLDLYHNLELLFSTFDQPIWEQFAFKICFCCWRPSCRPKNRHFVVFYVSKTGDVSHKMS